MANLEEFGYIVRDAREARGMNQATLGRMVGLSRASISLLERGEISLGRSLGSAGAALPQSGGYRVIRASQWASPPFSASCTSTDTGNIASNHRIALAGWRTESEGSSTPNGSQRTLV